MIHNDLGLFLSSVPQFQVQISWSKEGSNEFELAKLVIDFFVLKQTILAVQLGENIITFHLDRKNTHTLQNKAKKLGLTACTIENGIDNCKWPTTGFTHDLDCFQKALLYFAEVHMAKQDYRRYGDVVACSYPIQARPFYAVSSIVCSVCGIFLSSC